MCVRLNVIQLSQRLRYKYTLYQKEIVVIKKEHHRHTIESTRRDWRPILTSQLTTIMSKGDRRTDGQTDRQSNRQTVKQTDRQTDRQTD